MDQHCRDGSTSEGNFEIGPFELSEPDRDLLLFFALRRCYWSFAFTHASTSSKRILFAIRCLFQLNRLVKWSWPAIWIVSEMIDWLKVRDPALMKEIFCNPDNWEEPNSGSSTTGSPDRMDGRCAQENRKCVSDSETGGY
jgi:hypothetical protein